MRARFFFVDAPLENKDTILFTAMESINKIFVCTRCGFCCHGETTVSLDDNDQKRMALALNLEAGEVHRKYLRKTENVFQMKTIEGHCVFYIDGCTVHEGRPWRCAQWPLVPAILQDENNFNIIRDSCPGIKKDITYDEFCKVLGEYLKKFGQVQC